MNLNLNKCMRNEIIIMIRSSSSDGVHCHVEHCGCRRCRWVRERSLVPGTGLPTAEQDGQTEDRTSDHGSGRGENPMAEDALLGHRFGLLRHRLQFLNEDICIESSSDLGPQAFDS